MKQATAKKARRRIRNGKVDFTKLAAIPMLKPGEKRISIEEELRRAKKSTHKPRQGVRGTDRGRWECGEDFVEKLAHRSVRYLRGRFSADWRGLCRLVCHLSHGLFLLRLRVVHKRELSRSCLFHLCE